MIGNDMKRAIAFAALAIMMAGPALAAGAVCSQSDASKFKPKSDLETLLKGEGLTVRKIKTEGGCYEVYGIDKAGKKFNQAYNAETFDKVENPEAGEN